MPFGPLVILMLLVYILFLGVVIALWFALSPRRKPDVQEEPQRERFTRAEERSYNVRTYAGGGNDAVRGANVSTARRTRPSSARAQTRADAESSSTGARDTRARNTETQKPTKPEKKRKNDAFEDFIRSKNDDFDF